MSLKCSLACYCFLTLFLASSGQAQGFVRFSNVGSNFDLWEKSIEHNLPFFAS